MVDQLHRDPLTFRLVERPRKVAVESSPGAFVDFGLESGLQGLVGIVGSQEVGVTYEEAFFVVVSVDEHRM